MCGISGIFSPDIKIKKEELFRMRECLDHRGPDDSGIFIDENTNIGFVHNRLSIIELSQKGHQPMSDEDERLVIVYNGEIYNYRKLKRELEKKGYNFRSNSDTEVVLTSFKEWGKDCVKKFKGMFSFAIWDKKKEKLYLFRDRFGVKPLYYFTGNGRIVFASELKGIYAHPKFKKDIDFEALGLYFKFGYIPAPFTIFKNTFKLEEGTILEIDSRFNFQKTRYWQPEKYFQKEKIKKPEEEILTDLEKLFEKSFKYRMVADVDVGVFLSGGIDSSLVTAILQKNSPKKLKTFSIGFKEASYNEAPIAKKVAEILGTEHHEYYLSAEDLENVFQNYVEIFDEPFGDSSGLPTYLLAKFARQKVKVALSGDGGDELFLGYDKYKAIDKIKDFPGFGKLFGRKFFERLGPEKTEKLYSLLSRVLPLPQYSNLREKISKLTNLLKGKNLSELFQLAGSYWLDEELDKLFKNEFRNDLSKFYQVNQVDFREQMQLWDIKNYLADDILVKTDRTTMAVSLEAREPYLDQNIFEYVAQLSPEVKFKKGELKYLLKKTLYRHLPQELFSRPKTGFRVPLYEWFRKDWQKILKEHLDREKIVKQGIFQPDFVEKLTGEYNKGNYVNPDKLWILLAFQMWYKKWIE